jgi:hypothetical protein
MFKGDILVDNLGYRTEYNQLYDYKCTKIALIGWLIEGSLHSTTNR